MDHRVLLLLFVVVHLNGFHFLAVVLRMLLPVLLNRATLAVSPRPFPSLQVGACIVNAENKIVGIGYNGMPNGCSDDALPWRRTAESKLDTKYPYGRADSSQGLAVMASSRLDSVAGDGSVAPPLGELEESLL